MFTAVTSVQHLLMIYGKACELKIILFEMNVYLYFKHALLRECILLENGINMKDNLCTGWLKLNAQYSDSHSSGSTGRIRMKFKI